MGLGSFIKNKRKKTQMKKIFTLVMAAGLGLTAQAQSNGFYHIQNTLTGRYMIMVDNSAGTTSSAGNIDMESVKTNLDLDYVNTHPGSVVYVTSLGGTSYDVAAQGTTLSKLSGNRLNAQVKAEGEGYVIWGTYSGTTVYLGDASNQDKNDNYKEWSYIKEAGSKNRYWKFHKIDNSTHFLGIEPDVKDGNGNYWGSMYFGFPFKTYSDGMKVYYVEDAGNSEFVLKEWTGSTVPAAMPVIIRCSSDDPEDNIINPLPMSDNVSEAKYGSDHHLYGRYFDNTDTGHENYKAYDSNTMRVIGVESGELVFTKASSDYLTEGKYMPHNKAWLEVPSGAKGTLVSGTSGIASTVSETTTADDALYTLTGVKLPKNVTPKAGIYIKNGKKVVIK